MHLITVSESLTRGSLRLAVGAYLLDNVNAGELLARFPTTVKAQEVANPKPLDGAMPLRNPRILIIRAGGFGDLLFLGAAIRAFKKEHPEAHIAVSCFNHFSEVLENNPDVAEVVPYPIPLAIAETFDGIVPLENTVEDETDLHAVDRYLQELGVDYDHVTDEDKRCVYHLTEKEAAAARSMFPQRFGGKDGAATPRLGVQVYAGAKCRTYDPEQLAHACQMLHQRGWEIFFFGEPKSFDIEERDRIVNLTTRALTFRQSAAVLSTCDVVLAPDSALCHLAGALNMPTIALYGPFPWQLRTAYHPRTIALSGEGACAPCFHQVRSRQQFPDEGPCRKSGRCDVLASIKPGRIAAKVDALYHAAKKITEHERAGKL